MALDPDAFERALEQKALERPDLAALLVALAAVAIGLGALGLILLWRDRRRAASRPPPPGPPAEARHGFAALAGFVVAAAVAAAATIAVASRVLGPLGPSHGIVPALVATVVQNVVLVALALAVVKLAAGDGVRGLGLGAAKGERPAAVTGLHVLCMAFPVYSLVQVASGKVFQSIGWRREPNAAAEAFLTTDAPGELLLIALVAIVAAPLAEEILFRGLLLPPLRRVLGFRGAAALTAGLFALLHPAMDRAAIFVLGYALAVAYERAGSLRASIAAHAANNAWGILVLSVERYVHRA